MENKDFKTVFKYEDKVFDINYGWGFVHHITSETVSDTTTVYVFVKFTNKLVRYSANGSIIGLASESPSQNQTLSFTEYILEGFSQDRPIDIPEKGEEVFYSLDNESWSLAIFDKYEDNEIILKETWRNGQVYTLKCNNIKRIR